MAASGRMPSWGPVLVEQPRLLGCTGPFACRLLPGPPRTSSFGAAACPTITIGSGRPTPHAYSVALLDICMLVRRACGIEVVLTAGLLIPSRPPRSERLILDKSRGAALLEA